MHELQKVLMRFGTIESLDYSYGFVYVLHAGDKSKYHGNYCKRRGEAMASLYHHVCSCLEFTCEQIVEERMREERRNKDY